MSDRKATPEEIEFARSMLSSNKFWQHMVDATIKGIETFEQLPEVYADYAAALDKPSLTDAEKRQAILNHVLDQASE